MQKIGPIIYGCDASWLADTLSFPMLLRGAPYSKRPNLGTFYYMTLTRVMVRKSGGEQGEQGVNARMLIVLLTSCYLGT